MKFKASRVTANEYRMNRKLTIVLIIMAIIPIGLLSWMGIAGIKSERNQSKQQIQLIGNQRLELVRNSISHVIEEIGDEFDLFIGHNSINIDEIRDATRKEGLINQIFITDKEGLIYPTDTIPLVTPLSKKEEAFLNRIRETDISYNFLLKSDSENTVDTKKGWHTWFMGDGINFIYWQKRKTTDGNFIIEGIELNRSAIISRIIGSLPNTDEDNSHVRILLININGSIVYQWGSYTPPENTEADAVLSLSAPLTTWHLKYFIDPDTAETNEGWLFLIVSISTIFIVIISLSIYLYRESTREIREAAEKVSFVNQVSHELKTPLTNIKMYAELLGRDLPDYNKTENYLGIIISESSRLGRLINNVLSFAKNQKNGIKFNPIQAIPDDIIKKTLDSFAFSLTTKNIKLETGLNASKSMLFDPDILEQILSNLISNVEKYAANGNWIGIASEGNIGTLIITVSDKGPGIPDKLKNRIFEPFFRISNKLTDGVSGTGIGLALVRRLTEIHGGSAELLSEVDMDKDRFGPHQGAVFQIIIQSPEGQSDYTYS